MAVREVSAVREIEAENSVAGCDERGVSGHVRGRAGVWLHVGVLGSEELLGAVAREVLHHVGKLASAVIALAGIAFCVFVGEDRTGGFEHSLADEVLGGDQLEAFVLAALYVGYGFGDLRIDFGDGKFPGIGWHDGVLVWCNQSLSRGGRTEILAGIETADFAR